MPLSGIFYSIPFTSKQCSCPFQLSPSNERKSDPGTHSGGLLPPSRYAPCLVYFLSRGEHAQLQDHTAPRILNPSTASCWVYCSAFKMNLAREQALACSCPVFCTLSFSSIHTDKSEGLVGWFGVEIEGRSIQHYVILDEYQNRHPSKHFFPGGYPIPGTNNSSAYEHIGPTAHIRTSMQHFFTPLPRVRTCTCTSSAQEQSGSDASPAWLLLCFLSTKLQKHTHTGASEESREI